MITLATRTQLKRLNLPLLVAQGCYFAGFELPGFGDFGSPFLPSEWWNRYALLLVQGLGNASFEKAGRTLSFFSTINIAGEL